MPTSPWTALNPRILRASVRAAGNDSISSCGAGPVQEHRDLDRREVPGHDEHIHRLAAPRAGEQARRADALDGVALSASARTSMICWPGCRRQLPVAVRDWMSATLNAHYGCKPGSKVGATLSALRQWNSVRRLSGSRERIQLQCATLIRARLFVDAERMVGPLVDGVAAPVQHAQASSQRRAHGVPEACRHGGQIWSGSGGDPGSTSGEPSVSFSVTNSAPHTECTLRVAIEYWPRCVSRSPIERRYQLTGHAPGSTRPGRACRPSTASPRRVRPSREMTMSHRLR